MKKDLYKFVLLPIAFFTNMPSYSAVPVDLMQQSSSILNSVFKKQSNIQFKEIHRTEDKKYIHIRFQQMYLSHTILGADAIVHIPKNLMADKNFSVMDAVQHKASFMNGILYQNIDMDLANTPASTFNSSRGKEALNKAIDSYQHKIGSKFLLENPESELCVYVDKQHKAHWAFKISFDVPRMHRGKLPASPVYIIDATTWKIYQYWDDLKTIEVKGGGFGGNTKMGKLVYDGLNGHLAKLDVSLQTGKKICSLKNSDVTVKSDIDNKVVTYPCPATDPAHNDVYWSGELGSVNGGYSPGNDALFGGSMVNHMYQDWYQVPVLVKKDGSPMPINMTINTDLDDAYWDTKSKKIILGNGIDIFYPLTSLGVTAHEVSHGFTEQHAGLTYEAQSGGINESFSDMAVQAAEVYAYGEGKNTWQIRAEILKAEGKAVRYMDQPSKDCNGGIPGDGCSIDDASEYDESLDRHYSSGVYNRLFYLLSTTTDWNVKKAFGVMVNANLHYWTKNSSYKSAACGVLQSAKDKEYDLQAVKAALDVVKIDYRQCKIAN